MKPSDVTFVGGQIFDGTHLYADKVAIFKGGTFVGLEEQSNGSSSQSIVDLEGDILSPGYVDLQVNGGGGVMFNDDPSPETLETIAVAHRRLGSTAILPTLITDSLEKSKAAIEAVHLAIAGQQPGIAGLHLEGPHLSVSRKGAHDAAFIRPMEQRDLDNLILAKGNLPVLKITIAPESVTLDQVRQLVEAGILVSLGHTDADFDTCSAYAQAGASCVTHLFNAMSQMGNRTPGLVGAALNNGAFSAGLIADGIHVHPAMLGIAWRGKVGPGNLFLVTDAMAVAGTDQDEFYLEGRRITREEGRLTLDDGTLAGADLDLTRAVNILVNDVGLGVEQALRAATSVPAKLIGMSNRLIPGQFQLRDLNRISKDLSGLKPIEIGAN